MTSWRHRLGLLTGFLLIAIITAISLLPARWLTVLLPADSLVSISDASGTVWSGQAWLVLGPEHYRRALPEPVQWQIGWQGLAPEIRLAHSWLAGPVNLKPSLKGLQVSAQTLQMPATVLGLLHPAIRQINPEGSLRMQWPALYVSPVSPPAGTFTLNWSQAASSLSPVRPLGDYLITLQQNPDTLDIALTSRQGPLLLEGKGKLKQGQFAFDGKAHIDSKAETSARNALRPLLQTLGPVNNDQVLLRFH